MRFYPFGRDFHLGYSGNSIRHANPTAAGSDKIPVVKSSAFNKVSIRALLRDSREIGLKL